MSKIIFIDQGVGSLFREFVIAAAATIGPVSYYNPIEIISDDRIRLVHMPHNNNQNSGGRLLAWTSYLIRAGWHALTEPGKPLLFIVTNPPLSPVLGIIAKAFRKQRYILLFYDMYPEALERFKGLSKSSLVARGWRMLNRLAIRHADGVITISPHLAKTLDQYYVPKTAIGPQVMIVPTWVDSERIHPLPKEENWFAQQHGQVGKLTVFYGGNLGTVHDLTMLPQIAYQLREYSDIQFLIVGDGLGREPLKAECARLGLHNVILLPLQKEEVLPFSLTTADIGIVALANGAGGISMPSKTYYMMAAGSALLGLSDNDSDLAAVIHDYKCGINVAPGDIDGATRAILQLHDQPVVLQQYRENARQAAEKYFSRTVCVPVMLKIIQNLL
jgi:glycosyltransferase involved in cell wall biosynthesis